MTTLFSQLFIDGGDPDETRQANEMLKIRKPEWKRGIEGQTTNPTLVLKNPEIQKYLVEGKKLTQQEALAEYKKIVTAVAAVTKGPVSIQVIADQNTPTDEMIAQARVYKEWIPNGVIKFPCTGEGLAAAEQFCMEFPVNITLNFSQSQAAAVYQATAKTTHRVFISPFVGRLDDKGENGMDVVAHELGMYKMGDGHVDVLTASVRNLHHLKYAILLESPAITIPFKVFKEWADLGFPLPEEGFRYQPIGLRTIPYQQISLNLDWRGYNLKHPLTDAGLTKFMEDWRSMLR